MRTAKSVAHSDAHQKMKGSICTFQVHRPKELFDGDKAASSPHGRGNPKPQSLSPPLSCHGWRRAFLLVQPTGAKYWRFAHRHLGKRKTLHIGACPDVSLKQAQELLAEARAHVSAGRDPCAPKKAAKAARTVEAGNTFGAEALAWMAEMSEKWTESHVKAQRRRLEKDLLRS